MNNFLTNEEDIANWLISKAITRYRINNDLTIDVYEDVSLTSCEGFIPVQFGVIYGSFDCAGNKLTTLKGCPYEVNGDFNCSYNKLITLEGSPLIVRGNFYCFSNFLTSLKGITQKINGEFDCRDNKLTTLQYAPLSIDGDFDCSKNLLTSLKDCPEQINGSFDCSDNELITLEGCPEIILSHFDCSDNQLTNFNFFPKEVNGSLLMQKNFIDKDELIHFNTLTQEIQSDFGNDEDFYNVTKIMKINDEKAKITSTINASNKSAYKKRI